jgi:hypothetical protein
MRFEKKGSRGMKIMKTSTASTVRLLRLCPWILLLASCSAFAAQNQPAAVAGKWQLSWEARLGTERGTVLLEQQESKLSGTYQGRLGSPKVSGNIEGKNVVLNLDFPGSHPFTLVFKGIVEGDKMAGKFDVRGVPAGYDSHGENAHPTNYSWTAVRQPDQSQSDNRHSHHK